MSRWAGKYVIGLTGNIGVGKSVVRRMLEHLGAYGIDADSLAHRVIAKGGPGYKSVLDHFGRWLLKPDGEIDRSKLGKLVFDDRDALRQLENIIHPYVSQAIDLLIRRAKQRVVVVEAIKLTDIDLTRHCDSIWVVVTPLETQFSRLKRKRNMSRHEVLQRVNVQPTERERLASANVIIQNDGSFEQTWRQVTAAWQKHLPGAPSPVETVVRRVKAPEGEMNVLRGKPRHSTQIAELMSRLSGEGHTYSSSDVMEAFGEKAFFLLQIDGEVSGLLGWQVENLVSRTLDILLAPGVAPEQALPVLFSEMEEASKDLQSEASLVFAPTPLAKLQTVWEKMGYQCREPQSLGVSAWQEAAIQSMPPNAVLYFKQLRVDRVLRPM